MTDASMARGGRFGHAALWGGAGLVVLAAHAGAIAWMLREPTFPAAESAPPAAVMIELSPEPEAVDTSETAISPDRTETEEVASEATEPVEEPTPPEPTPPEPELEPDVVPEETPTEPVEEEVAESPPPEPAPPEMTEPEPPAKVAEPEPVEEVDPVEQEMLARLEGVVIPTPVARPKPPAPRVAKAEPRKEPVKTETARRKPARNAPAPAQRETRKAKAAEARPSTRTAARQSSSGYATASISPAKWQSRLMSHLERRKRYPRGALSRGQLAVAHVRFRIDEAGNVLSASLARSSGVPELDAEVVALVRRASPVPPPPPGTNRTITAPVRFRAR